MTDIRHSGVIKCLTLSKSTFIASYARQTRWAFCPDGRYAPRYPTFHTCFFIIYISYMIFGIGEAAPITDYHRGRYSGVEFHLCFLH